MDHSSRIEGVVGLRFGVCHSPSLEVRSDDDVRGGVFVGWCLGAGAYLLVWVSWGSSER